MDGFLEAADLSNYDCSLMLLNKNKFIYRFKAVNDKSHPAGILGRSTLWN